MRRVLAFCASTLGIAGALVACGMSRLPQPEYVSQPTSALERVPYPPPPARVEFVPDKPRAGAVWVDGEWTWQGRRWAWRAGRWVIPPNDAAFAPWIAVRDKSGVLYVAAGTWRDKSGKEIEEPEALANGHPGGGSVVNPEGETQEPGPVVHGQQKKDASAEVPLVEAGANPPKDVEAPEDPDAARESRTPDPTTGASTDASTEDGR